MRSRTRPGSLSDQVLRDTLEGLSIFAIIRKRGLTRYGILAIQRRLRARGLLPQRLLPQRPPPTQAVDPWGDANVAGTAYVARLIEIVGRELGQEIYVTWPSPKERVDRGET